MMCRSRHGQWETVILLLCQCHRAMCPVSCNLSSSSSSRCMTYLGTDDVFLPECSRRFLNRQKWRSVCAYTRWQCQQQKCGSRPSSPRLTSAKRKLSSLSVHRSILQSVWNLSRLHVSKAIIGDGVRLIVSYLQDFHPPEASLGEVAVDVETRLLYTWAYLITPLRRLGRSSSTSAQCLKSFAGWLAGQCNSGDQTEKGFGQLEGVRVFCACAIPCCSVKH